LWQGDAIYPAGVKPGVEQWYAALSEIINDTHVSGADELAAIVGDAVAPLGLSTRMYLADLEQRGLHPVDAPVGSSLPIGEGAAGQAFRHVEILTEYADGSAPLLWVPLLDGAERFGVLCVGLPPGTDPEDPELRRRYWVLAGLLGHIVASKIHYGDLFHTVRRTRPLSVPSELLWQLVPPQTFACPHLVVSAVLQPYDEVAGDAYDYAVVAGQAHVAVFDAVGHDLEAGLAASMAVATTRNARRAGLELIASAALADEILAARTGVVFATALLARLDLDTGVLHYLNAGHPPPVLLRGGRVVKRLDGPIRPPLGLGHLTVGAPRLGREQLERGDRVLLYTDGITEARDNRGTMFGLDRLVELAERHHDAGLPAPETLRQIAHAVFEHQHGRLQDDATLLLVEWADTAPAGMLPRI